ncbi:hypothetical protein HY991_00880 [Candidatus Micrarchaeota archaeon]|nr:hypothetical protein [Candidatus Micrarchaeota archaeon]
MNGKRFLLFLLPIAVLVFSVAYSFNYLYYGLEAGTSVSKLAKNAAFYEGKGVLLNGPIAFNVSQNCFYLSGKNFSVKVLKPAGIEIMEGERVLVEGVSRLESRGFIEPTNVHAYSLYPLKFFFSLIGVFLLAFVSWRERAYLRGECVA